MPILDENTLEFISRSPEQTRRIGIRLGALLETGNVVCLSGQLGAGKTTLVQGIAQGWGSLDLVTSPTFVLINNYRRPDGQVMAHLDAYRLENADEALNLDIDYLLESGPLVIEWPEKIIEAIPLHNLWVDLKFINESQRNLAISPKNEKYYVVMRKLQNSLFRGSP